MERWCGQDETGISEAGLAALCMTGLGACAAVDEGFRELPNGEVREAPRDYSIAAFDVLAPRTLEVSEANLYYPIADIVWRGDPFGDRYEQIEAIFDAAGERWPPNSTASDRCG